MDPEPSRSDPTFATLLDADDARSTRVAEGRIETSLRALLAEWRAQRPRGGSTAPREVILAAFVRMLDATRVRAEARLRFFVVAAGVLRRILVEKASRAWPEVDGWIESALRDDLERPGEHGRGLVLALDRALTDLESVDPPLGRLVELRGFGGFGLEEIADLFSTARENVVRDWGTARAWLRRALDEEWCGAV